MNLPNKIALTLAILLLFSLAACSSAATPTTEQPAETEVVTTEPTLSTTSSAITDLSTFATSTPQPTQETIVLEGAETTASGLQFLDVKPGNGATPQEGDILSINFTASLPDGTEIANTQQEYGKPITIVYLLNQILPGLDEGLALMKVGGTAKMVLPPELAFGEAGYGMVPGNSQVILDVELVSAEEPPQPTSVASSELTTTDSGLKYADLATGEGETVEAGDIVSTYYTLWVQGEDEAKYITSSNGSEPLTFTQGTGDTVFPGWEEGMLGMQVGGKRLLVIPPDLGFGQTGNGTIPADATLVMEVELVDRQEPPVLSRIPAEELTTTDSGLAYYDIVTGEGAEAADGLTVLVHYSGWLEDGTLFDSSVTRNEPFRLTLGAGSVIPGWEEGLVGMKVGGKRQLVIPPDLAYGESGAGGVIPADATLIFDVELLEVTAGE